MPIGPPLDAFERDVAASHTDPIQPVSILFNDRIGDKLNNDAPECLRDLNIDQIINRIVADREEYDLRAFFYTPLRSVDEIQYRNAVFRDCRNVAIDAACRSFAATMREIRGHFTQTGKLHETLQKHAWLLDAATLYCGGCVKLHTDISAAQPQSKGLQRIFQYLDRYIESSSFLEMKNDGDELKHAFSTLRYKVIVDGGSFTVQRHENEVDYSADVLDTFARFKQENSKDHHTGKFTEWPDMNHIEAKILEFVSLLYAELFKRLEQFCDKHTNFLDPVIQRFDREIQFYLGYLDYVAPIKDASFCDPKVCTSDKREEVCEGFDLALAVKLANDGNSVVCNSYRLSGNERILVVSGPNQGGKTTFARMFGQLHYLAAIGCPIPGRHARIHLFDRLFTHFEREESIGTLAGNLQDDLDRIRDILMVATSDSIVILNEIFTSTSLADALLLSKHIIAQILTRDMLAVWVTFVDELSRFGPETVSMVSDVVGDDPTQRTFKITRKPADGRSYAMSLAEKHGLTYERILGRVRT